MMNYLKGTPEEHVLFKPRSYICQRASMPAEINGKLDKPFWEHAPWSDDFEDIEWNENRPVPYHRTRMKMLWDDDYLYIGAYLEEDKIWATLKERDDVIFYDNDFEVFIDPDGDTHAYCELEVNALNTVWDLLLITPYRDAHSQPPPVTGYKRSYPWDILCSYPCGITGWDIAGLKTAVHIDGVLNDVSAVSTNKGWSLEIALPWKILKECASGGSARGGRARNAKIPKTGDYWRIDFSRIEWRTEIRDGKYAKVINPETGNPYPEDNWIWSPIGLNDIHYPELWGFVYFTDNPGDIFEIPEDEQLKWELRKLYYMQRYYFLRHGRYCTDYHKLCGDETGLINPVIEATSRLYEASVDNSDGTGRIVIRQDGRCTIEKT
jgi:hypothetical protein